MGLVFIIYYFLESEYLYKQLIKWCVNYWQEDNTQETCKLILIEEFIYFPSEIISEAISSATLYIPLVLFQPLYNIRPRLRSEVYHNSFSRPLEERLQLWWSRERRVGFQNVMNYSYVWTGSISYYVLGISL